MAVFTTITNEEACDIVRTFGLGGFVRLRPIMGGIENTNYYLDTSCGKWVLTIFERLVPAELPFYLELTEHLGNKGCSVARPVRSTSGNLFEYIKGKPYSIANCLDGEEVSEMGLAECRSIGEVLAHLHLAAKDYPLYQKNLRGLDWVSGVAPKILPFLSEEQSKLFSSEIAHQIQVRENPRYKELTVTACHCDLFRNNALISDAGSASAHVAGVFDFYFAGCSPWLFDLAVTLNDWCIDPTTGLIRKENAQTFLKAYHAVRPLTETDCYFWRDMLRAAALRFWTSRLFDFYLPRKASMLKPHDPTHFERVLRDRLICELPWPT